MVDSIQSPEPIYITISNLPGFRYSCSPCEPLPSSSFLSAINEHVAKERAKMKSLPPLNDATHLGDGLYASFDGFQIWLATMRADSLHRVALEPEVYQNLLRWIAKYSALAHHMEGS